jgi:hypothetical protein
LPFLSRQFIGDDWLWLANAKKALNDPNIFIGRPMYGYFRPLNMVVIFLMQTLFGANASIFSFLSIILHATNVFLLWKALKEYEVAQEIRLISSIIFGFYYLNCSAIEWISVGHDLWVTGLMLAFLLLLKKFHKETNVRNFLFLFLTGWAAALFKESGLAALGFYFGYFLIYRIRPFSKKYWLYSTINIASYAIFIFLYFITRTNPDKPIELGIPIIINIWYFLTYLIMPLAKRIVGGLSGGQLALLKYIKGAVTLFIPAIMAYIYFKGSKIIKLFVIWPILFLSTVAVFKWGVALFTLYPDYPASRFMYTPFIGMAVCLAWLFDLIVNRIFRHAAKTIFITGFMALFIVANYLTIWKSSSVFRRQQEINQNVINDIQNSWSLFENADSITVLTNDLANTEQIISSGEHLPAILFVKFNKNVPVTVKNANNDLRPLLGLRHRTLVVGWDIRENRLLIPKN